MRAFGLGGGATWRLCVVGWRRPGWRLNIARRLAYSAASGVGDALANMLEQLTEVKSQLVEGLEAYLESFVDLSMWDESPAFLFLPHRLSPKDAALRLYQPPEVVNRTALDEEKQRRRVEADARGEFGRGADAPATTPWAEERGKAGRALILGRPGEGKTLLTRLSCRDVARDSLALLRTRTRPVSGIPIPIWLRFENLLKATDPSSNPGHGGGEKSDPLQVALDATVPQAVANAVKLYFKGRGRVPSPRFASDHIRGALGRPSTWLFIDALDEPGKNASASADVNRSAALLPLKTLPTGSHVVMTSRTREYNKARDLPQGLPDGWLTEYELEPMNSSQQRTFIRTWYGQSPKADDLWSLLDGHPQFRDMATNGLMLTLICATAELHPIAKGTRRVELYEWILRDMVGRVRTRNPIPSASPIIGERLDVLREVAWSFFSQRPDNTSLDEVDWKKRLIAACGSLMLEVPQFAQDLRDAGLLVSHQDGYLRFLHRSFFEFLAGARMARRGRIEIVKMVCAHVEEAPWREALVMAVGHLGLIQKTPDEAGRVVKEIVTERPGPPGSAIVLMGDAVADGGEGCVPPGILRQLRDALLGVMRTDAIPAKTRAAAGSALGRIGDHRFHNEDLWCLPKEELLGFVEIPEGEFWMGSNT